MAVATTTVLAYAAIAATLAGAGISAYSAHQQGKAQEQMGKYNAKVAENAALNEAQTAAENAKRQREQNRRQLASIRARMAGGGQQIGAGSALDVLGTASSELELQTLDLFRDSEARRRQNLSQASMSRWEGAQAARAGNLNAMGSLLSGAGSASHNYVQYTQSGVLKTGKA